VYHKRDIAAAVLTAVAEHGLVDLSHREWMFAAAVLPITTRTPSVPVASGVAARNARGCTLGHRLPKLNSP
jgi:hypothetical protein